MSHGVDSDPITYYVRKAYIFNMIYVVSASAFGINKRWRRELFSLKQPF